MPTYWLTLKRLESGSVLEARPSDSSDEIRNKFESWDDVTSTLKSVLKLDDREVTYLRDRLNVRASVNVG
jgi:hypothetical protein